LRKKESDGGGEKMKRNATQRGKELLAKKGPLTAKKTRAPREKKKTFWENTKVKSADLT